MNTISNIIDQVNRGNLFATRDTIAEAFTYVDAVSNSLSPADKVAVLTAVAVLCNSIRDQLVAAQ